MTRSPLNTLGLSACHSVCLPVCKPVYLSACQSVCVSVCMPVSPSVCLSTCLSLSICLSVYLSVCQPVYLSACRSVCVSVCLPVSLSVSHSLLSAEHNFSAPIRAQRGLVCLSIFTLSHDRNSSLEAFRCLLMLTAESPCPKPKPILKSLSGY